MWSALKKVLSVLTDILTLGRSAGWWEKKPTPNDTLPLGSRVLERKK